MNVNITNLEEGCTRHAKGVVDPGCNALLSGGRTIRIYRFTLTQPMMARDGTPVVVKAAYPGVHLVCVQGVVADRDQEFVDLQMFDAIEIHGSRVTLEVDGKGVEELQLFQDLDRLTQQILELDEASGWRKPSRETQAGLEEMEREKLWPLLQQDLANARTMIAVTWHAAHVENTLSEAFLCRWAPKSVPKLLAAEVTNAEVRERLARHQVHLASPYVMGEPSCDSNEDSLLVIDSKVVWIPGWDIYGNTVRSWIRLQGNKAPRLVSCLAFLEENLEQAARGYELPAPTAEVTR